MVCNLFFLSSFFHYSVCSFFPFSSVFSHFYLCYLVEQGAAFTPKKICLQFVLLSFFLLFVLFHLISSIFCFFCLCYSDVFFSAVRPRAQNSFIPRVNPSSSLENEICRMYGVHIWSGYWKTENRLSALHSDIGFIQVCFHFRKLSNYIEYQTLDRTSSAFMNIHTNPELSSTVISCAVFSFHFEYNRRIITQFSDNR